MQHPMEWAWDISYLITCSGMSKISSQLGLRIILDRTWIDKMIIVPLQAGNNLF